MDNNESKRMFYAPAPVEILGVSALVGAGHYALSAAQNFNAAASLDGLLHSADVGITAGVGALAYCVYRFLRTRSPG